MVVDASGATETWGPDFDTALGMAWEPDGKSVLSSGSRGGTLDSLWRFRPGQPPKAVFASTGDLLVADLARDGRALVIQTDWRQEIEVCTADGAQHSVAWLDWGLLGAISDDGSKVLMAENGKGSLGKWILLLRDVKQPVPVKLGPGPPVALSPDGRWVVTIDETEQQNLLLLPTGAGDPRPLPPTGLAMISRGTFFPDGRRLALIGAKTPGGLSAIYVYDPKTPGSPPTVRETRCRSPGMEPESPRQALMG